MKQRLNHISNTIARRVQGGVNVWASGYWHNNPFGMAPRADEATYRKLWDKERVIDYPDIDDLEKKKGYAVDKEWLDELALHTQIVIKRSPLCYQHGRVLYAALRKYLETVKNEPAATIVETGTARGFSSTVMAKALQDAGKPGKIMTFDVLPHRVKMLWNCIDDKDGPRSRAELLKPWSDVIDSYLVFIEGCSRINLPKVQAGRIHFAFLDGGHGYRDVMAEFGQIVPLQNTGDVIVFDDYSENVFPGLVKAVDEGCLRWDYNKEVLRVNDQRAYVIATKK